MVFRIVSVIRYINNFLLIFLLEPSLLETILFRKIIFILLLYLPFIFELNFNRSLHLHFMFLWSTNKSLLCFTTHSLIMIVRIAFNHLLIVVSDLNIYLLFSTLVLFCNLKPLILSILQNISFKIRRCCVFRVYHILSRLFFRFFQ